MELQSDNGHQWEMFSLTRPVPGSPCPLPHQHQQVHNGRSSSNSDKLRLAEQSDTPDGR